MKYLIFSVLLFAFSLNAQNFNRKDSLRGNLTHLRLCYDVTFYDLNIAIDEVEKSIEKSTNIIHFNIIKQCSIIQVDLASNLEIMSIVFEGNELRFERELDAVYVYFNRTLKKGESHKISVLYGGYPKEAKNPPWDGGFVFKKDSNGKDFIAVAVQGTGASLWFPVKDSQTDEPDNGASIKVAVPNGLMNVSNGRFLGSEAIGTDYTRWDWEVKNPINNYTITVNIADYVHIHDSLDDLDLDYYVLRENEEKARKHFDEDVKPMMNCFQTKFGKYPFWEDGYKLVETPYLGMEHQSAVAYGNKYKKGYMGYDLTGTGVGMFFDYITIHETGHEWFGNSVTSKDIADMWIHEGFTTYSETVFIECMKGYEPAMKYINGQAKNVRNDRPIIGEYGVNNEGSGDMYYKGSLLLNTLRHIVNDDDKWWKIILNYSETFKKQIIDTQMVIAFFNKEVGMDLTSIFKQYLYTTTIPEFNYTISGDNLEYFWSKVNSDFNMPMDIECNGKIIRLFPTTKKQTIKLKKLKKTDGLQIFDNKFFVKISKKQ